MAKYRTGNRGGYKAGANLNAKQFYIVKQDTDDNTVVLASAATDLLLGVLADGVPQNENAPVHFRNAEGTFKVICGGSVSRGDKLTSDANGKAVATTTTGNQVLGIAMQNGDANDIIEFMPAGFALVD